MRIENLRTERHDQRYAVAATVIWEDCDRPIRDVFFEVDEAFAPYLSCGASAFLVGSFVPAMRHGEKRIAIDEPIDPRLCDGLATAMAWLCHWYGPPRKPVHIEAQREADSTTLRPMRVTGSFLSGGVDSLATLRANRLNFPLAHTGAIRDGLIVHGFDIGGTAKAGVEEDCFEQALTTLQPIAMDAEASLIPVYTNIRYLDDDVRFWMYEFHGAALASVAHALANRFAMVLIASGFDISNMSPSGSHPLIDPNCSSTELQIGHDGVRFSRLDKIRLIADWEIALQNLRVCTENRPCMLNCGECEKCIRTMTELQVVGRLADTQVFPERVVSKEMLDSITITDAYQESCYADLIAPLRAAGSIDLAMIIEKKLAEYHRRRAWEEERDWKGAVKRFDRLYFGATLYKGYSAVRYQVAG